MRPWRCCNTASALMCMIVMSYAQQAGAKTSVVLPRVASVSGLPALVQQAMITGRDGTWSVAYNGSSYWSFNDTWLSSSNLEGRSLISNSLLWTNNLNASAGITLTYNHLDAAGAPMELFPFTDDERAFTFGTVGPNPTAQTNTPSGLGRFSPSREFRQRKSTILLPSQAWLGGRWRMEFDRRRDSYGGARPRHLSRDGHTRQPIGSDAHVACSRRRKPVCKRRNHRAIRQLSLHAVLPRGLHHWQSTVRLRRREVDVVVLRWKRRARYPAMVVEPS